MPDWYWDKETIETKTPSMQDGISRLTEYKYRQEGAKFIIDIGGTMDLGYNTVATGVVFFHRFYMLHSFKEFPRYVTAACCLFLAGKVEETPKKCKDIIKVAKSCLDDEQFATFGIDPKEEVMTLEKILLQTIKFDLKVQHPYCYLTKYAKCLKGDKNKLQKMVQMAWTFINDSLCTTLSVEWEPEIIAIAVMYLAGKLSQFQVKDWYAREAHHLRWWDLFVEDLNIKILEDICHQILDLYSPPKEKQGLTSSKLVMSINNVTATAASNMTNTTLTAAISNASRSLGSSIIFTTTMTANTSTTNSTSTMVTPVIMPGNIKTEKASPTNYPATSRTIFPWAVLPPSLANQASGSAIQSSSMPGASALLNFYIKQENSQNSENDSPSPNFPVQTQLLRTMMSDQSKKSFMYSPTDSAQENRNRNQYCDMFRRSDGRNFQTNWDNRDIWDWSKRDFWDARESYWDVKDPRNDGREYYRQYYNFRRHGSGPMKSSRRFFKN